MKTVLVMTGENALGLGLRHVLREVECHILASTGTAEFFRRGGVEAKDVYHGKPKRSVEREIEACRIAMAILGDKDELAKLGVGSIDLVAVSLNGSTDVGGRIILLAAEHPNKVVVNDTMKWGEIRIRVADLKV